MAPQRTADPQRGRADDQQARPRLGFRPDIEGLRAIAIGAVLLCHASLPFAEGGYVGVDVFFVISGFLITRMLVAEIEQRGTIDLVRFYAYRVKRLLPTAALVLVFTALGSAILFSPALNEIVAGDILAAAVYVVNWHFAAQAVDYFAATEVSPVQHFWSLAIEEQFYLVWPLLLLGASMWWRRSGRTVRPALIVAAILVGGLSLFYSARYTAEAPNAAFFSTLTRGWELALGGLLALVALPQPSRRLGALLGFAGLAAIAYATLFYDASTPFPGTAALVPALGTVALLVAGTAAGKGLVTRALETRPFRYVGRISYSWYLWHWPVLIFGLAIWGPLPVLGTTALIAASWIPTVIGHHLIEQRFRLSPALRAHPWRAVALGPACGAVAALSAVALIAVTPGFDEASDVAGASALKAPKLQRSADAISPKPTSKDARGDRGAIWDEGCLAEPEATSSRRCVFGEPSGRQTVVLFGDSHAMAFFGAVEELAKKHRWRLVALTKAGCPPFETDVYNPKVGRQYDECVAWHEHAVERIEREEPDTILTAGSIQHKAMEGGELITGPGNVAALERGYVSMLERLRGNGARLVALKDLPKSPRDMTDCVSENLNDLRKCAFRPGGEYRDSFDRRAVDAVDGAEIVDLSPAICADGLCFGVIGDALVYRDNDHLTATFSRTLAPWLDRELTRARG